MKCEKPHSIYSSLYRPFKFYWRVELICCTCSCSHAVLTDWETKNRYRIRNTLGQDVYFAAEGKFS